LSITITLPGNRILGKLLTVFLSKLLKIIFIITFNSLQLAKLAKKHEKKDCFSDFFANFADKLQKAK